MQMIQGMFESLMTEIQNVRTELKEDIQNVRTELKQDITNSENRIKALIENDTHKRIQAVYEGYQLVSEKVSGLETDVQEIQDNTEILNALREYHK